jgi:hypothetical protein
MTTFIISNPTNQHAAFYYNNRPLHVPMRDQITLEAGLTTVLARDAHTYDALKAALDGPGRKLGLTYQTVEDETPSAITAAHIEGN